MPRANSSILPMYSLQRFPAARPLEASIGLLEQFLQPLLLLVRKGVRNFRGTLSGLKRPLSDLVFIVPDISQCQWVLRRLSRHQTRQ